MKYITFSDMASDIRNNIHRIPHDIDLVVGVARSGMLPATIISEFLNRPLVDVDNFCNGCMGVGGGRMRYVKDQPIKKILVVDDSVCGGYAMRKAKEKLRHACGDYEYFYLAVYGEGKGVEEVDLYFIDIRQYVTNCVISVLYEWNVFQHNDTVMGYCIYDMDGVLCSEPPDEYYTIEYENYITNAIPKITPVTTIGEIVTYRIEKYRDVTEKWLKANNISYNKLVMFPAQSYEERAASGISAIQYKADYYKNKATWIQLFVESSDYQAKQIYELTGKPVLSVETNIMYGSE